MIDLHKFWIEERDNMPRWFQDGINAKKVTWEEFQDFAAQMWKIWDLGDALVYAERHGDQVNIHFSKMRGSRIDVDALAKIRDEILTEIRLIFGWCAARNKGLRDLLITLGFADSGLRMYYGQSHGKVLEWHCYTLTRNCIETDVKTLLS